MKQMIQLAIPCLLALLLVGCVPDGAGASPSPQILQTPPVSTVSPQPSATPEPPPILSDAPMLEAYPVTIHAVNGGECTLVVGMTKEKTIGALSEAGIFYSLNGYGEQPERYMLGFNAMLSDEVKYLDSISVTDDSVSIGAGLRVGDSEEKMTELLGPAHLSYGSREDGYQHFSYFTRNYVLMLVDYGGDGTIDTWSIDTNEPEQVLALEQADGETLYLQMWNRMDIVKRQLASYGLDFTERMGAEEIPSMLTKAEHVTVLERDDVTLWFGYFISDPCEPTEEASHPDPDDPNHISFYRYTIRTEGYATLKGLCVGDSEEKMLDAYGQALEVRENDGVFEYEYELTGGRYTTGNIQIIFTVKDGTILEWTVYTDLTVNN